MIQRVFALLLILSLQLFAKQYNTNIINIEAKLFVKIALLEEGIRSSDSPILSIYILAKKIDENAAKKFQSAIEADYPNVLLNKRVTVQIVQFNTAMQQKPDAVIVLQHKKKELQEIAAWANKNKIVSFAYDPAYLKNGLLVSLYLGKTTKPYLNKKVIQEYGFVFNSYLMQLSKFKE